MKIKNNSDILLEFLKKTPSINIMGDLFEQMNSGGMDFDGYEKYSYPGDTKNVDFFASYRSGELLQKKFTSEKHLDISLIIDIKFDNKNVALKMKEFILTIISVADIYNISISTNNKNQYKAKYVFNEFYDNDLATIQAQFNFPDKRFPANNLVFYVTDNFDNIEMFLKLNNKNKYYCFFDCDPYLEDNQGIYKVKYFINTTENRPQFFNKKELYLRGKKTLIQKYRGQFLFFEYNQSLENSLLHILSIAKNTGNF